MSDFINTFRRYKTLNYKEFQKILNKNRVRNFYIYSDNILESIDILGLMAGFSEYLKLIGVFYEPIDQPVYVFKEKRGSETIVIKVCGSYNNWELPKEVTEIISYLDKPDFIIVDSKFKPVFVGETTGTANVGNSQWQREGRKIKPAQRQIPFVYQTYYSGTDRSQGSTPQIREPSSLQVINHLIYCLRYGSPSFVIYYPNEEYDLKIDRNRTNGGRRYFANYISIILLNKLISKQIQRKRLIEKDILMHMLEFLNDRFKKGKDNLFDLYKPRINKDFPKIPKIKLFTIDKQLFINYIVERINGGRLKKTFNILEWNLSGFPRWGKIYRQLPLIKEVLKNGMVIKSYLAKTKVGIVQETSKLISLLSQKYGQSELQLSRRLDKKLPTIIFPARIFKGKSKVLAGDPESGEIVAFAELFSKNLDNQKSMNFLIYGHIKSPRNYPILEQLKASSSNKGAKIFKAIHKYADLFIFNEQIILW